jgi:hypothetical protein
MDENFLEESREVKKLTATADDKLPPAFDFKELFTLMVYLVKQLCGQNSDS